MEEDKTSLHVDLVKCRQQLCETTQIKSSLEKLRAENSELRSVVESARAEAERGRSQSAEQRSINERLSAEIGKVRQEATAAAAAASRDKEALMSEIAALSEKHLKVRACRHISSSASCVEYADKKSNLQIGRNINLSLRVIRHTGIRKKVCHHKGPHI